MRTELRAKGEQRDEMRGVRLQALRELMNFMGIFVIHHQPTVTVQTRNARFDLWTS